MAAPMRSVLWDVIAPAVRWPLWSPARFVGVIAVVLLLVILGARLSSGSTEETVDDRDGRSAEHPAPRSEVGAP